MNNDFTFIIITILALVGGGGYLLLNQPFTSNGGNNKTKKNRTSIPYFKNEFNDNDKTEKNEIIAKLDKPKKRQNKKIITQNNVSSDKDESDNDSNDSDEDDSDYSYDTNDGNDDNEDYNHIDVGDLNENIKPKKYTRKQSKK
jgi:hypothetical protein